LNDVTLQRLSSISKSGEDHNSTSGAKVH